MRKDSIRKKFLKKYRLIDGNGVEHITNDLPSFCKEYNINLNSMYSISSTGKSVKGWLCFKL